MLRIPSLKALRVFQQAAELGSFKLAAQRLHVTQAAISQQIRALEADLGVQLFERLNREVRLTAAARQLLPYLQTAFSAIEEGVRGLSDDPNPDQLKITTISSFAARWLVPRLQRFQQSQPGLSCYVTTTMQIYDFSDNSQDLAIRFSPGRDDGLTQILLAEDYIVPLCHPHLLQRLQSGEMLQTEMPLLIDDSSDLAEVNPQFRALFGGEEQVALKMKDASILIDAALNGQGVAATRFSLAQDQVERGLLVPACPVYWPSPYRYYLVAPETYFLRHKVSEFQRWVQTEAEDLNRSWQCFSQTHHLRCAEPPVGSDPDNLA
ncbi:LysR substrate-binding domain-containing protein [Neptuniibacter halophilus]|uniref:LysR substrate-binding domain-containing protein n=1 Tax=Neptuniibacter halophilus TaxID=651666 RepID=UPI0025729ACA|nr:LysR substrate-binding domain-containing protein [Neptuniibacter halophilus]